MNTSASPLSTSVAKSSCRETRQTKSLRVVLLAFGLHAGLFRFSLRADSQTKPVAIHLKFNLAGFRCCYCFHMNEARKQRPNAPRLNLDTTIGSSDDGEEEVGLSDSDSDTGTIPTRACKAGCYICITQGWSVH